MVQLYLARVEEKTDRAVESMVQSNSHVEVESESDEEESSNVHTEDPGSYDIARDITRREIIPPARLGDYDLAVFALLTAVEVWMNRGIIRKQ